MLCLVMKPALSSASQTIVVSWVSANAKAGGYFRLDSSVISMVVGVSCSISNVFVSSGGFGLYFGGRQSLNVFVSRGGFDGF